MYSGRFPRNRFYSLIQRHLGQPVTGSKKNAWYVVRDGLWPNAFSDANLIHSPSIMIRRHHDPVLTLRSLRSPGLLLVFLFVFVGSLVCVCVRARTLEHILYLYRLVCSCDRLCLRGVLYICFCLMWSLSGNGHPLDNSPPLPFLLPPGKCATLKWLHH